MDPNRQIRAGRHPKFYRSRPNLYLRWVVSHRVRAYRNQNRPGRSPILLEVLEHLQSQGFTFWKKPKGEEWVTMTEAEAIKKIGHAFRDTKGNGSEGLDSDSPLPLFVDDKQDTRSLLRESSQEHAVHKFKEANCDCSGVDNERPLSPFAVDDNENVHFASVPDGQGDLENSFRQPNCDGGVDNERPFSPFAVDDNETVHYASVPDGQGHVDNTPALPNEMNPQDDADEMNPQDDVAFLQGLPDLDVLLLDETQLQQSPAWDLSGPIPF